MSDEILNRSKPNRATALEVLMPDGGWWGEANGKFFCDEGLTLPTEEQIQAKLTELKVDYDSKQYQRDRQTQYPELPEQLDMLFHAIDAGALDKTSTFYTTLKAVKDKYPKG